MLVYVVGLFGIIISAVFYKLRENLYSKASSSKEELEHMLELTRGDGFEAKVYRVVLGRQNITRLRTFRAVEDWRVKEVI